MKENTAIKKWVKLNEMYNEISNGYFHFPKSYKNELLDNFNIDSGLDYANYIFNIGNIQY